MRRLVTLFVVVAAILIPAAVWVSALAGGSQSLPGAPTIGIASAKSGGAYVTVTAPTNTGSSGIVAWVVKGWYAERAGAPTSSFTIFPVEESGQGLLEFGGLTNGSVYQFQVAAVNASGVGPLSEMSNTITPAARTVPRLDPSVTWILPSWDGVIGGSAGGVTVAQMAQRLRDQIGEGPKARVGLSQFLQLEMPVWTVNTSTNSTDVRTALAGSIAQVDAAIAQARTVVSSNTSPSFPIGFSLITAIRERTDGVEAGAQAEDLRNVQWYHDWPNPTFGNGVASGWTTYSQYARKMRRIKEAYVREFGSMLADRMAANPGILVAVTGDGEIEMSYERFRDSAPPAGQTTAQRSWADYSPFAVAEFRDWMRGTGIYGVGGALAGQGFAEAARYAGDNGLTNFNTDFRTNFTTWDLKYHNWTLADSETARAVTSTNATATTIALGFDAPRPDPRTILAETDPLWLRFREFRNLMVLRYNRDFAQWITEGAITNVGTRTGGVPYDRWYSAQVPTNLLFGNPPTDLGVRHLTSGSPHTTANIAPYGGMGVTGYNVNGGGQGANGNASGFYDRTVGNVAPLVAALSKRWAIVEWNPADPWSASMDSYRADNEVVRRYRPTLLMPYKINNMTCSSLQLNVCPEHQWAIFAPAKFVDGLRELMQGQAAVPATVSHPALPARTGIAGTSSRGGWLSEITWTQPAPILVGTALSSTQLNATANRPGTFTYSPASGQVFTTAGTQTLTATFTPTDTEYAVTTATVSILVKGATASITGRVTGRSGNSTATNLAGVTVTATSANFTTVQTTTSGADGTYTLSPLPFGDFFVYFEAPGYNRSEATPGAYCVRPGSMVCPGASVTPVSSATPVQRNVALLAVSEVTGRVVDGAGNGVSGVGVAFYSENQAIQASFTTGPGGTFRTGAALYRGNYVRQIYSVPLGYRSDSVFLPFGFVGGFGTIVAPDLRIESDGGSIQGTVSGLRTTDAVVVVAYTKDNVVKGSTLTTIGTGTYTITGLDRTLSYYVKTRGSAEYTHQIYPARPCDDCPAASGDPVSGNNTQNINFALTLGGRISGRVAGLDGTGLPATALSGFVVEILGSDGRVVASGPVTAGTYSVTGLATGSYYARTAASAPHVNQIYKTGNYGGVDCLQCGPASGSAVAVTPGTPATGIDFTLPTGGSISGTITGDSGPLSGGTVKIFDAGNRLVNQPPVNGNGVYSTTVGLPTGDYYVQTNNGQGYNDEHYNDNGTVGIAPNTSSKVAVVLGQPRTLIDFTLIKGGWVSGRVTGPSGQPLGNVTVVILTMTGNLEVGRAVTNTLTGNFQTTTIPGGSYFARAEGIAGHSLQYFCITLGTCATASGNAFGVPNGVETTGINFQLPVGGTIAGTVSKAGTSDKPSGTVEVYSEQGDLVASGTILATGEYSTSPGLPTGGYFVRTRNTSDLPDVLYQASAAVATPTSGTPVRVTAGQTTGTINLELPTGGFIKGTVRDNSNNPLPDAGVEISTDDGTIVSTVRKVESDGTFVTDALRAGTYFARATAPGFQPQIYQSRDGVRFLASSGRPITVTAGQDNTTIDFSLPPGPTIKGRVLNSLSTPMSGATVEVYNSAGVLVITSAPTDEKGNYRIDSGLTGGQSYRLRTRNTARLIDQQYPNVSCGPCLMTAGQLVSVTNGVVTADIDFTLPVGATMSGKVTRARDESGVPDVTIAIVGEAGNTQLSAVTNALGEWTTAQGLASGSYRVRTGNAEAKGLINELYDNIPCVGCSFAGAAFVEVGTTNRTGINFALESAPGSISGELFDGANTARPVSGVRMRIYNQSGAELQSTVLNLSDASGIYTFRGLTAGRYFVQADPPSGEKAFFKQVFGSADPEARVTAGLGVNLVDGQAKNIGFMVLTPAALVRLNIPKTVKLFLLSVIDTQSLERFKVNFTSELSKTLALARDRVFTITVTSGREGQGGRIAQDTISTFTTTPGEVTRVNLDIPVCTPPDFSTSSLANGKAGVAYSQSVSATGGTGALSYLVADGYLPPGLALNASSGAITGTPTASGTGNFTLGAQGTDGCLTTREFFLTTAAGDPVNGTVTPSSLRFTAVKNGAAGALTGVTAAQTVSLAFTAGVSPSWTVSASQPWLTLSTSAGTGAAAFTASIVNPSNVIGASTSLSATITVTGTGIANGPLTIPVTLTVDQTNGATATLPFGQVDTPTQNAAGVQGAIGVTGWVLDNVGVTGVKIYRNCLSFDNPASCQVLLGFNVVEVGDAAFLAGARPDVEAAFSTFPQNNRAGWGYLMLTSMLPHVANQQAYGGQGALTLYAIATDVEGNRRLLGRSSDPASTEFAAPTSITMANDSIAKPFGAIDTPSQGQTVSGLLNNFGWALTPDSNTTGGEGGDILIPTNGSTMTVFIDSLPVALVAYNQCRGNVGNPVPGAAFCNDDVANIFGNATPQSVLTPRVANTTRFRNLDAGRAAIGVYSFNTATLSNGLHTIAWSVTDSAGRTEGIGSRFFNVLNSGADPALTWADDAAMARADATLRNRPAEIRGAAWLLNGLAPGVDGVWVRRGFDLSAPWMDLPLNDEGQRVVEIAEAGRLDLWLGAPIERGYLVANGTLRDLPVGASVDGARVTWAPPAGYTGTYLLALVRGGERVEILVKIGSR